jgi:hypothetical protein
MKQNHEKENLWTVKGRSNSLDLNAQGRLREQNRAGQ